MRKIWIIAIAIVVLGGVLGAIFFWPKLSSSSTVEHKFMELDLGDGVKMKLVCIPAGKFMMGSPDDEQGRKPDEGPQREVQISKNFYMGVCEVTNDQFGRFVADSGYVTDAEKAGKAIFWDGKAYATAKGACWKKSGFDQNGQCPVLLVSHNDAVAFCKWLSVKTGKNAKLPTEAQWEYAYRCGKQSVYPWGNKADDDEVGSKTMSSRDSGFTVPVGKFEPNMFGLYDMSGNVREWCSDWYDKDYYSKQQNVDPQGPYDGTDRVMRGCSHLDFPRICGRSALRDKAPAGNMDLKTGFRIVVD